MFWHTYPFISSGQLIVRRCKMPDHKESGLSLFLVLEKWTQSGYFVIRYLTALNDRMTAGDEWEGMPEHFSLSPHFSRLSFSRCL
jgi:hypothetical protein